MWQLKIKWFDVDGGVSGEFVRSNVPVRKLEFPSAKENLCLLSYSYNFKPNLKLRIKI